MNVRLKKVLLLLLAAVLLAGVSQVQRSLNRDREKLGLTRVEPLKNAPPVLAFTTVALGGFRGLISNMLWIRASDLQDEDKFFEMQQLADWITKLEPHFVQVWLVQAWNMAYNISVKFKETEFGQYPDRWRWVRAGIVLLRDEGLRYNPYEPLIYRELAWFFQHKMGANLDDAHNYYKMKWYLEMSELFKQARPNFDEFIQPQTEDAFRRLNLLTNDYKMDPVFLKAVDERYGPLEWRLPESHAIYWAARGLEMAKLNERKIDPEELIKLRRAIYQSMQLAFQRGKVIPLIGVKGIDLGPNLEIIPKVNDAYNQAIVEDAKNAEHIKTGHRNFVKDAIYFLFTHNRMRDAAQWYRYLGEHYPNKTILDGDTNSFPRNVTLDEYCVGRVQVDIEETDRNRIKQTVEGMIATSFQSLVVGEDEQAAGLLLLARRVQEIYLSKVKGREMAIGLPAFEDTYKQVLNAMLDPEEGLPPEYRATLRAKLSMPPEAAAPASTSTNTPPAAVSTTNAPVTR